jgi:hypothetical protein
MTPRGYDRSNTAHACCRLPASHTGACQNAGNRRRSCMRRCRPTHSRRPAIAPIASVVIDHRCYWPLLARSAGPGTRHQIAIEPAAAGYSPFRDFVHCRFADAGRRWVWLRSPTAGIRKPSQQEPSRSPRRHGRITSHTGRNRCGAEGVRGVPKNETAHAVAFGNAPSASSVETLESEG